MRGRRAEDHREPWGSSRPVKDFGFYSECSGEPLRVQSRGEAAIPSGKALKRSGRCRKPPGRSQSSCRVVVMKVMAMSGGQGFLTVRVGWRERTESRTTAPASSLTHSLKFSWLALSIINV